MANLVFQVNISPNNIKTSGKKKFIYSNDLYSFSNMRAKEYANKYHADYFCLQESWEKLKELGATFHKLYLYVFLLTLESNISIIIRMHIPHNKYRQIS